MRRVFTNEYKLECVKLVLVQGYTHAKACEVMNVGLSSLTRWIRQYRDEQQGLTPVGAKALTPEQQRIQELEAKVKSLERDKELLKKASAFFAVEMQNNTKLHRS